MKPKHQRLWYLVFLGLIISGISIIVLVTINDHLMFFVTPTDLVLGNPKRTQNLRLGGLVAEQSLHHEANGQTVHFTITDQVNVIPVVYSGALPDLFREGQGVVAEGSVKDGVFVATRLLAKHDENYMPREVANALKERGEWRPTPKP